MRAIEVVEIRVRATAGSAIWDCKEAAALLALTEKRTVRLIHNDVEYVADPNKLAETVCNT